MNTNSDQVNALSHRIIGCALTVSNTLGAGFVEKVYENALAHELRKNGMRVVQQGPIQVTYDGVVVGDYTADLLVDGSVIVELKAVRALDNVHIAQCMNYLKATGLTLCMLINFGKPRMEFQRIVNGL